MAIRAVLYIVESRNLYLDLPVCRVLIKAPGLYLVGLGFPAVADP